MFVINPNAKKIEEAYKYKYIISIPLYWNQLIWLNYNNNYYVIKFITKDKEFEHLQDIWIDESNILVNVYVVKIDWDKNWDWIIDWNDIKELWIFESSPEWIIRLNEKWKEYLLNKQEVLNFFFSLY